MAAVGETLRVDGLAELQRAFKVADKSLERELRAGLRRAAEPVRVDAEALAASSIRRITLPWSRMRVGVTTRSVYVAPRQKGARHGARRRSSFAGLLLDRSMLPALRRNEPRVAAELDNVLATVGKDWERV